MNPEHATENSRDSVRAAGWVCDQPGRYLPYVPARSPLSWLNPSILWKARNDTVARTLGDPTDDTRRAWMQLARRSPDDLVIDHRGSAQLAFMVVGDPGEGDASQWATVPPLQATWQNTAFMVIMSDVIYPSGNVNEYEAKFYRPYRDYRQPIYAVPGNHDWYDELHGFMFHMCGIDGVPELPRLGQPGAPRWKRTLHRLLWRRPDRRAAEATGVRRGWRPFQSQRSRQRTPYWTVELDELRLIGIDTGILGGIDREQGEWLQAVSLDPEARDKPKVLITGKPLVVDGAHRPGPIEGGGTVDEIVRMPEAGYVAAIGGDIHNYQRYPMRLPDGRTIQYIVAGGGGAFMHPTHTIPRVRLPGVEEDDFVCYPRRGDSLSIFSKLYDRKLAGGCGFLELTPDEAAAYLGEQLGVEPTRSGGHRDLLVTKRVAWAARRLLPLPGRWHGPLHPLLALWFDLNDPPMFKSFLRMDTAPGRLSIRCYAATGCRELEQHPPLEDAVVLERDDGGAWSWRAAH